LITSETFEDITDILITARGQLNDISWPDLPGLDKFQGKVVHSADWDETWGNTLEIFRA
jgi:cation diffusion facilitator CzcD-associated flavoprotein CzcO